MDKKTWDELKSATAGHTPGPWIERGFSHVWGKYEDATLAAAAPALLAEVERLREWLKYVGRGPQGYHATHMECQDALNGKEAPK